MAQTLSDPTDLDIHSTPLSNGEATAAAELSVTPASETQETQPSSSCEPPTEPASSPELEEAVEGLSLGKSLRVMNGKHTKKETVLIRRMAAERPCGDFQTH